MVRMVQLILSVIGKERTGRRTVRKEKCTCSIPCQFPPLPCWFWFKGAGAAGSVKIRAWTWFTGALSSHTCTPQKIIISPCTPTPWTQLFKGQLLLGLNFNSVSFFFLLINIFPVNLNKSFPDNNKDNFQEFSL